MLVFLLKNGRLRLQVFLLALVIGMEFLPLAAPLQCYVCSGEHCRTNYKENATECPQYSLGNLKVDRLGCTTAITATSTLRQCELSAYSKICAEQVFKRSCITAAEQWNGDFSKCIQEKVIAAGGGTARDAGNVAPTQKPKEPVGDFCFCEGDLCNTGEEITKAGGGGGGGGGSPGPSPVTGPGGPPAPTDDKKSDNGTATGGPYSSFNTFGVLFFAVLGGFVSAGSVMVRP